MPPPFLCLNNIPLCGVYHSLFTSKSSLEDKKMKPEIQGEVRYGDGDKGLALCVNETPSEREGS